MKKYQFLLGTLCICAASLAGAATNDPAPQPLTKEVQVGINDAYIPGGFDSSSDVYVVTSGIFPNGCYRWNRATAVVSAFTHNCQGSSEGSCSQS